MEIENPWQRIHVCPHGPWLESPGCFNTQKGGCGIVIRTIPNQNLVLTAPVSQPSPSIFFLKKIFIVFIYCVFVDMHDCVQRPVEQVRCLPLSLSVYSFEAKSLLELRLNFSVKLDAPSRAGVAGICGMMQVLGCASWSS